MTRREQQQILDRIERLELLTGIGFYLVLTQLERLIQLEEQEMSDLTQITDEVAENTSAVESAVTLLSTLAEEIRSNASDPMALAALADQLDANNRTLADAVLANTPSAPPVEEPPVEP